MPRRQPDGLRLRRILRRSGQLLAVSAAATVLASCTLPSATRQSVADIRAREPILFTQEAFYGITLRRGQSMVWQGRTGAESGDLILTPTTLYFVYHAGDLGGSRSIAVSYAAISEARVESVTAPPLRPSLIPGRQSPVHENLLLIRTVDGGAGTTYAGSDTVRHIAFHLIGSPDRWQSDAQAANRACSIINKHRKSVHASGSHSQSGRIGLTTECMSIVNPFLEEALLKCGIPAARAKRGNFLPPEAGWNEVFHQQFLDTLAGHPSKQRFQPLPAIPPSSDFTVQAEKVSRRLPELAGMIIVSLRNTRFSADSTGTRVTATYTFRIGHFDLRPAKPGYSRTLTHTVTRSARQWADGGHSCIRDDLREVANRTLSHIAGSL